MGRWGTHLEQQGFSEVEATVLTSQGRELPQGQDSPAPLEPWLRLFGSFKSVL